MLLYEYGIEFVFMYNESMSQPEDICIKVKNYYVLALYDLGSKCLGLKITSGENYLGSKCLGHRMTLAENYFGSKLLGLKITWVSNNLGLKITWAPNDLGSK